MLYFKWVSFENLLQKLLKKIQSLSNIIDSRTPWNLIISLTNILATIWAVYGCLRKIKCAYLLRWSTTTITEFIPFDFGRPSMKSTVSSWHTLSFKHVQKCISAFSAEILMQFFDICGLLLNKTPLGPYGMLQKYL